MKKEIVTTTKKIEDCEVCHRLYKSNVGEYFKNSVFNFTYFICNSCLNDIREDEEE